MCRSLSNHYSVSLYVLDGRCNETKENIDIFSIGKSKSKIHRIILSIFYVPFLLICSSNKVFHLHDPELLFCALFLKLLNKKVIFDVHEDYSIDISNKDWIYKPLRSIIVYFYKFISSFTYTHTDLVIAATDGIALSINSRHCIIKNYPRSERILKSINLNKEYTFCYVGSISVLLGLSSLLYISSKFKCRLLLIGDFASDNDEKYFKKNANQYVQHIGYVEPKLISEYLSKCYIGLHLVNKDQNLLDGLPLKILEYICSGIHVICSDSKTWRSNFVGLDCIHYMNLDKLNNCNELIKSITNNSYQTELINSINLLKKKYVWETQVELLLLNYNKVINGN